VYLRDIGTYSSLVPRRAVRRPVTAVVMAVASAPFAAVACLAVLSAAPFAAVACLLLLPLCGGPSRTANGDAASF
jgi:hypothetical protein